MSLFTSVHEMGSSGERRNMEVLGVVFHCKLNCREHQLCAAKKSDLENVEIFWSTQMFLLGVNTNAFVTFCYVAVLCSLRKFGCLLGWG